VINLRDCVGVTDIGVSYDRLISVVVTAPQTLVYQHWLMDMAAADDRSFSLS
jgi:hypothetical protein